MLVSAVDIGGFRSARDLRLRPGPVCALVGEPMAGKSNVLAAIRAVLDPESAPVTAADVPFGEASVAVRAELPAGGTASLRGAPPDVVHEAPAAPPPVLWLPAAARAAGGEADPLGSPAAAAASAVASVERWCAADVRGALLLMEDPELYLAPQTQRYLSRLLRRFAAAGNQVVYSTRSPAFLNVARLEEVVFVERDAGAHSRATRPAPVSLDEDFRVLSEFDAERAELLLSRAAILVEGRTEKLALPFVFSAVGADPDHAGVSIVECGGKANIPLFARVCASCGIPFVCVFDSDTRPGRRPGATTRRLNALIAELAGPGRIVVLEPDFEGVAGLTAHAHKPEHAWRAFSRRDAADVPEPLLRAVRIALDLAGADGHGGAVRDP